MLLLEFCSKKEVLRLRELKSSYDYLLRIRANAIADSPRWVRVFNVRRREVEKRSQIWTLSGYYDSISTSKKRYIAKLTGSNQRLLKPLAAGLAPLNEGNAICLNSLVGEVIVASEALRHFYYFMTFALSGTYFEIDLLDRVTAAVIAIRIMNGAESLDFDIDPRGQIPDRIDRLIRARVEVQMEFTFGHEYAHYMKGHLSTNDMSSNFKTFLHDIEYEADFVSIDSIQSSRVDKIKMAIGACDVLFFSTFFGSYVLSAGD